MTQCGGTGGRRDRRGRDRRRRRGGRSSGGSGERACGRRDRGLPHVDRRRDQREGRRLGDDEDRGDHRDRHPVAVNVCVPVTVNEPLPPVIVPSHGRFVAPVDLRVEVGGDGGRVAGTVNVADDAGERLVHDGAVRVGGSDRGAVERAEERRTPSGAPAPSPKRGERAAGEGPARRSTASALTGPSAAGSQPVGDAVVGVDLGQAVAATLPPSSRRERAAEHDGGAGDDASR